MLVLCRPLPPSTHASRPRTNAWSVLPRPSLIVARCTRQPQSVYPIPFTSPSQSLLPILLFCSPKRNLHNHPNPYPSEGSFPYLHPPDRRRLVWICFCPLTWVCSSCRCPQIRLSWYGPALHDLTFSPYRNRNVRTFLSPDTTSSLNLVYFHSHYASERKSERTGCIIHLVQRHHPSHTARLALLPSIAPAPRIHPFYFFSRQLGTNRFYRPTSLPYPRAGFPVPFLVVPVPVSTLS
ncbi:hypothetical protein CKAH01_01250 [Colletotrichum kahawae]|uniref:Uncharacterized protein n=1 Tax=Colletotrichum kahawae TaxID=34407 RepID=A0AAD9YCM5_COLKA|nr:hypothetical protein CKAH01_01250 [Colletotrichum kahawae]